MTHKKGLARQTIVMAFLSCRRGRGRTKKVPFLDRAWQIRRAADGDFFCRCRFTVQHSGTVQDTEGRTEVEAKRSKRRGESTLVADSPNRHNLPTTVLQLIVM